MNRTIQLHHRINGSIYSGYTARVVNRSKHGRNHLVTSSSLLRLISIIKKYGQYKKEYDYQGYYIINL